MNSSGLPIWLRSRLSLHINDCRHKHHFSSKLFIMNLILFSCCLVYFDNFNLKYWISYVLVWFWILIQIDLKLRQIFYYDSSMFRNFVDPYLEAGVALNTKNWMFILTLGTWHCRNERLWISWLINRFEILNKTKMIEIV